MRSVCMPALDRRRQITVVARSRRVEALKHGCGLAVGMQESVSRRGPVRPNFFIVGGAKCGTTTLFGWLRGHPEVFFPVVKEPSFFGDQGGRPPVVRNLEEYLGLFAQAGGHRVIGDASPSYLQRPAAAQQIHDLAPDAKIVICLRNPVDMIRSRHAHRCLNGREPEWDLERALVRPAEQELARRAQRGQPWADYLGQAHMAAQVQPYLDLFGRDRVLIVVLEELAADPQATYRRLCAFVGIAPAAEADLASRNVGMWPRSRVLSRVIARMPRGYRWVRRRWYRRLIARLRRANLNAQGRPPLAPALRARLGTEFSADVAELERLLGRDLSVWRIPRAASADLASASTPS